MDLIQIINKDNYPYNSIFINTLIIKYKSLYKIYNNNSNSFRTIFIFVLIIFLLIFFINNNKIPTYFSKIELKKEIMNLEEYYKICNAGILLNKTIKFIKIKKPKISIISSIYNKQNYILRFLRSIQNQNFKQIEIILY